MQVMTDAVRKAGRRLARDFGEIENLQVSKKGPADFVTASDMKSEEILFEVLSKARPGYGFLMEERGVVEGTDRSHRWIIDPLDGTLNFMHAQPHFAISVALEREGELVAGVVFNPVTDELYHAEKGRGAYVNDRRLRVADRADAFNHWLESREVAGTIRALRASSAEQRDEVLARARRRLAAGEDPEAVLEYATRMLANRLAHAPSRALRTADPVEQALLKSAARKLFDLSED